MISSISTHTHTQHTHLIHLKKATKKKKKTTPEVALMEERGKKTAKSTRKRTSRQEKKNDKRNYLGCAFTLFWITAFIFRACVFVQVFVFISFLGPNSATYQHASL